MDLQLPSLDSLGHKFGTDKASGHHGYLEFYESHLHELRHRDIKILEIGIQFGSSLRMWEEYFPNGTVIGVDIHPGVKTFTGDRILTEILDQSNLEDLVQLGLKHGPFDVVVEDGSHMWEHQISTFRTLFPFLKPDGIFIIEDLQTNYGDLGPKYRGVASVSCMDYLKKLVDLKVADEQISIADEEDLFLRTYARKVEFITFLKRACIVKKSYHPTRDFYMPGVEAPESASGSLVETSGGDTIPVSIGCHIGTVGDWFSDTGAIRSLDERENIQGFVISSPRVRPGSLEYRARLADGHWTDWLKSSQFAGTMGIGQSLTGFSARLLGTDPALVLKVAGLFRGQTEAICVADAEQCVPRAGTSELYAIQCILSETA